jgi:putative FmdB family regulatory protein
MERLRTMPVYEYQCTECGQIEEALQKISEPPKDTCIHCKGSLKKIISQSTFHLKGSGWYVTDYGGNKNGSEANAGTKSDVNPDKKSGEQSGKKPGEKSDAGSGSKPGAKSDTKSEKVKTAPKKTKD